MAKDKNQEIKANNENSIDGQDFLGRVALIKYVTEKERKEKGK